MFENDKYVLVCFNGFGSHTDKPKYINLPADYDEVFLCYDQSPMEDETVTKVDEKYITEDSCGKPYVVIHPPMVDRYIDAWKLLVTKQPVKLPSLSEWGLECAVNVLNDKIKTLEETIVAKDYDIRSLTDNFNTKIGILEINNAYLTVENRRLNLLQWQKPIIYPQPWYEPWKITYSSGIGPLQGPRGTF